jgi:aspartyl-tRNA(Asn)/glutamyl-tRNA(Gln) amidotransferase subunit A
MEYAVGMPDPEKPFPIPHNPFSLAHWPGGSSSGTGSGVAAGLFLGGLGTDTGGSIRMPAAWCGISGLKQTFGRVPKSGMVPLGYSFDNVGPMTRSARDCAIMLAVLAGYDESDACSVDAPVDDYVSALTGSVQGMRIGVDLSYLDSPLCDSDNAALTRAAVEIFANAGAIIVDAPLPMRSEVTTATMSGLASEAFAYHMKDLQSRWSDYGAETRMAIGSAALITAADYVQMQRVRRTAVKAVAEMFTNIDVHLTPTALTGALRLDSQDFGGYIDVVNTPYWNGVGNPAISIPMGMTSEGLPVGLQLAGRPFEESTVLRAADAFQQFTDHHLAEPAVIMEVLA